MMEECDDKDNGMMAYVRYRLEKAQEVYEAANVLYMASQWNSVINRLYYACFYSATALLLYKKISAKSHSGVIGQFSEQIVRTGLVSIEEFRVYAKLLNWCSKGDYNDLFDFTKEDVDSMMNPTKHFIDKEEQEQYVKELMNSIQKVCVHYPREIHVERVQECVLRVSGEAFTFDWDGNTVLADVYDLMSLLTFAGLKVRVGVHMRLEDGFVCDDLITLDEYWDNLE